jgi:hypothetical protein
MKTLKTILRSGLICVLFVSTRCSCSGLPNSLARQLKCGMSTLTVREIVARSGVTLIANDPVTPVSGTHTVARGRDRLWLMFSDDRLLWIRFGQQAGWTGMRVGPKLDLCTGEQHVSLIIHGDSRWSGAAVAVDGRILGVLSGSSTVGIQLDVASRRCHVVVTKGSKHYASVLGGDGAGRIQIDLPRE